MILPLLDDVTKHFPGEHMRVQT